MPAELVLRSNDFCRRLKLDTPFSSRITISPSSHDDLRPSCLSSATSPAILAAQS